MNIGAGELDERISVFNVSIDNSGQDPIETETLAFSTFARARWASDADKLYGGGSGRETAIRFVIRKRALEPNARIHYDGMKFEILGSKPISKTMLEITAGRRND